MSDIKVDMQSLFEVANDATIMALMKSNEALAASAEYEAIIQKRTNLKNKAQILELFKKVEINETAWELCLHDDRPNIRYVRLLTKRHATYYIARLYDIYAVSAYMIEHSAPGWTQEQLYNLAINNLRPTRLSFTSATDFKKHLATTAMTKAAAHQLLTVPADHLPPSKNAITEEDFQNNLLGIDCLGHQIRIRRPFDLPYSYKTFKNFLSKYIGGEVVCSTNDCLLKNSVVSIYYLKPLGGNRYQRMPTYIHNGVLYYRDPDVQPCAALNLYLENLILDKLQ